MTEIQIRELTLELWPAFEELFGKNGACGGCWCMFWRMEKGERWEEVKGPRARKRMKSLIGHGKALGALAFIGDVPVGWCSYGPRRDYPKLDRARTLACSDSERVWSLPCFFIKRAWRGQGVATALLNHALKFLRTRGAEIAEGYPVKQKSKSQKIPDAFAWTGFELVGSPDTGKLRMRRKP